MLQSAKQQKQEIIRRYFAALDSVVKGTGSNNEIYKLELLMKQAGISEVSRKSVVAARELSEATGEPAAAIELNDGAVVKGKTSNLLGCASAML